MGNRGSVRRCSCGTRLARDNRSDRCSACVRAGRRHPPDVPAEFWDHPGLRAALAARDIGGVIRAYRKHPHHGQPVRQATVAAWIGLSPTRLSRIENGEPVNDLTKLVRWAQLLRIPQHLLWFRAPGLAMPESPDVVVPAPTVAVPSTVEDLLMNAAEESSGFLQWAEGTNVGDLTVDQLHAEVRRIAHSYLKVPTLPVFMRAKALRDRAAALLAGHQAPQHTRELYAAAGWSLTMLSWISVDLGRPDAAEDHARAAWMCAERSDHNPLRAWVRATQHTAAFWQNDYTTAGHYAADGLRYSRTGTAALFLASALALDLARAGDAQDAETALNRARRIAETAGRAEDELSGPLTCSVDRAGSLWSDTELALGRADDALALADRAVATFEATPEEYRNRGSERMARLQQVKAHLVLGDLAAADDALQPVLETPADQRVRPLVHRVSEVATRVATTGRSDPVAKRIVDAVRRFRSETVTKELTT